MKKHYESTHVEIAPVQALMQMMIPTGLGPYPAPPREHYVPGPGASYNPQGSIV